MDGFQIFRTNATTRMPHLPNSCWLCPTRKICGRVSTCVRPGTIGKLHRQCHRRRNRVRTDEAKGRELCSVAFVHYYNERALEHTVDSDSGAQIRDGMKVVAKQGAPPETDWPYDISKFADKPPAIAFTDTAKNRVLSYQRVNRALSQFKGCLASGYPFVFGFTVYDSFESAQVARTGNVPMPQPAEKVAGGHAVLAVGYDDQIQWFIVRNSWGPHWGIQGYFTMPYQSLLDENLSDDFWTVRLVEASSSGKPTKPGRKKKKR